jgi:hypothetical protein
VTGAKYKMAQSEKIGAPLRDEIERLATEELLQWAHEMNYFGTESFVWDTLGGLDLVQEAPSDSERPGKGPDELLSNLSRNGGTPLSGGRRRRSRRTQGC